MFSSLPSMVVVSVVGPGKSPLHCRISLRMTQDVLQYVGASSHFQFSLCQVRFRLRFDISIKPLGGCAAISRPTTPSVFRPEAKVRAEDTGPVPGCNAQSTSLLRARSS